MPCSVLATYALYASIAASIACSVLANAHLRPGKQDPLRVFFWREKSDFTEKGWKFRQASLCFMALAVVLIPVSKLLQYIEAR
ncbi:hypothetical protein LK542_02355 [Massilia sp. IC2-477]|uniref:hypothetical protein n=1 Tax=Massilia sp. IC2-477 TaxID=2887198 RepID=UPI001D1258E9|nr:hypothetical protein [Massilia sp. IC2-477]MCC2954452.1 hypothetical protein [Massilia sp. IC2-477]